MKELTVEAKIDNIGIVTDFLDEALDAINCPMKAHMQIAVALDELFTNIAHYSYAPSTGNATIRVEPDKDREIGGLGIFLVRKTMDDLSYEYINNQNVVRIKKVLHPKK